MQLKENSTSEFKENWRDDCLKTICAFANTDGGKVYIGVNDKGIAVGVINVKKLIQDIPNKIASKLGLFVSIEQEVLDGKEVAIVKVNRYKVPVSYNGKFYIRSGSTTQVLNDKELQRFLLIKSGLSWDNLVEERATLD
ncbi:MAG: ATP-binding protein, partial [Bacteroidetes bacterium]|nr:ATP-binding protein [Bacteroidota bacterium]